MAVFRLVCNDIASCYVLTSGIMMTGIGCDQLISKGRRGLHRMEDMTLDCSPVEEVGLGLRRAQAREAGAG